MMSGQDVLAMHLAESAREQALPLASKLEFQWFNIDAQPREWDQRVAQTRQSLFHRSAVLGAHAFGGARRRGVLLYREGRLEAAVGGLLRGGLGGYSFESLSFASVAGESCPELAAEMIGWLRDQDVLSVRLGSFAGGVEACEVKPEWQLSQRLEFLWSLEDAEEERLKRFRNNHRRKLKKLLTQKLELREISRHQRELMTWLRIRWAQRRGKPVRLGEIIQMYRYYGFLQRHLTRSGMGRLYGLYDVDDTLLSMAYMLETEDACFYMIGASSPAGYQQAASIRLFWDLGVRYAQRGYRALHLGGVPKAAMDAAHDEHGTYRFKADFGIEPVERTTLSYQQ